MMKTSGFLLVLLLLLGTGCQEKRFDNEKELWAYVSEPDNGYRFEKQVNGVEYTLLYRPTDMLVQQELLHPEDEEEIDSLRQKYGKFLYFNLSMKAGNRELLSAKAGDRAAFGQMVNQLAFGMDQKVHLISQTRDTVPLFDYSYPRMYGMSNSTTLMLVYPRDEEILKEEYLLLRIKDLGFGTGEVGFKVPTKVVRKEPGIHFKS